MVGRLPRLARRIVNSAAHVAFVCAPAGFGKSDLAREVANAERNTLTVDINGHREISDLIRTLAFALFNRRDSRDEPLALRPRIIILDHADEAFANEECALYLKRWTEALAPHARVVIMSRMRPTAFAAALEPLRIELIGSHDLAFEPDPQRLEAFGFSSDGINALTSEFGHWPLAWNRMLTQVSRFTSTGAIDPHLFDLETMLAAELDELDAGGHAVAVAAALLEVASFDDLCMLAVGVPRPAVLETIERLGGLIEMNERGQYRTPRFIGRFILQRFETIRTKMAAAAVAALRETDPERAVSLAIRAGDYAAARSVIDGADSQVRMDLVRAIERTLGVAGIVADDDLILASFRTARSYDEATLLYQQFVAYHPRDRELAQRAHLASTLLRMRISLFTGICDELTAISALPWLRGELADVVNASRAYFLSREGRLEAAERVLPTLDPKLQESLGARFQYEFVRSLGNRKTEAAAMNTLLELSRSRPTVAQRLFDLGDLALRAFATGDDVSFAAKIALLREIADVDPHLDAALKYMDDVEGATISANITSIPPTIALLVRAAGTDVDAERALHLRAAMRFADSGVSIFARIVARVAYFLCGEDENAESIAQAHALATGAGLHVLAAEIARIRDGEAAAYLAGLTARFRPAAARPVQITLNVFKQTVTDDDGTELAMASRQLELLTFLGLHASGSAARDTILDAIWPDVDMLSSAHALKTATHRVRTALRDAGALELTRGQYKLAAYVRCDVVDLERLLLPAQRSADAEAIRFIGGPDHAMHYLQIGLQRLHDGFGWAWIDDYLPRLETLLRALARALAATSIAAGDPARALRVAAELRRLDDSDDTAFRIAIDAHIALGNHFAARREFKAYSDSLQSLGDAPDAAIVRRIDSLEAAALA